MEIRVCADPCCGKEIIQMPNEKDFNFKKRKYCNKICAGQHQADKQRTKKNKPVSSPALRKKIATYCEKKGVNNGTGNRFKTKESE